MNWHKRSIFDDYRSVITKWCYVQVLWIMSTYTYLFYLSIFDSYSSQAQWILLRRRRAEVEAEVNSCFSVIANNCFRIIAQVLPNSVVNSIDKESIAHILLITHITINRQLNKFTWFNQQKLRVLLWKVFLQTQKHLNFLLARFALPRKAAVLKFSAPATITSREVIVTRYDAVLN